MIHQPSNQSMFAHAFINEFISFITARNEQARRQSWLTELQSGSMAEQGPALELSMQATALAYCGTVSGNPAAVREACNIYGRALTKHSRSLTHDLSSPKAASLGTCVMLSFFEAICSTNPVAYGTHLQAAKKMLALMPCAAGHKDELVIWQLGQHLFVMLATPDQYLQHEPVPSRWTKMTQAEEHPATSQQGVDRLMYDLFYLTDVLVRTSYATKTDTLLNPDLSLEIDQLWFEFQEQATQLGELVLWPVPSGARYHDPFIAMVVAYFGASWVLLSILEPHISSRELRDSCHAILESSCFLGGKNLGCAHLRMFFPLTLVAMYGPYSEQREAADRLLGQRIRNTAFKGMGSVAISRVQSGRMVYHG
ncbi:Zn(2)-C6 fungal-type domain-containing protein [Fusarium falciforme]|uniref:Zn(2)-C6 fungal-type domain-containing protein n=1 Tax=Fusarium falciforme TaxID=195108 RepID=UPI00230020B7|nr:Zn(2)-C6 fungal-type domain-containing protein [Fusarium falciforme]WAO87667.1 Zn(2)-C6 fungal-type domain-containing protein [Fusarium falciforme]